MIFKFPSYVRTFLLFSPLASLPLTFSHLNTIITHRTNINRSTYTKEINNEREWINVKRKKRRENKNKKWKECTTLRMFSEHIHIISIHYIYLNNHFNVRKNHLCVRQEDQMSKVNGFKKGMLNEMSCTQYLKNFNCLNNNEWLNAKETTECRMKKKCIRLWFQP